jgi:AmmeMemoRadiSam system protein B
MLAAALLASAGCKGKDVAPSPAGQGGDGEQGQVAEQTDEKFTAEKTVYWNQVAGRFYPGEAKELESMVVGFLKDAGAPPAGLASRDLLGFITPHAGYPYSGPVAGHAYSLLSGRTVHTVIVLGFAHRGSTARSAVLDFDAYRTPLGPVPIDGELVDLLLERGAGVLEKNQTPFAQEHSLEVQLPFIQKAAPAAKIVPIMVALPGGKVDRGLVDLLYEVVGNRRDVVIAASTDLSHYEPYGQAVSKDGTTLDRIASLDWSSFEAEGPGAGRMCGYSTVGVILGIAAKYAQVEGQRVKYLNSGDTAGDKSGGVVGYGVVAFTLPEGTRTGLGSEAGEPRDVEEAPAALSGPLSQQDRALLLDIAQRAARAAVRGESFKPEVPSSDALKQTTGVLVNIRVDDRARGTGGGSEATVPLYEAVALAARDAVASDARYPDPVEKDLASLACEIVVIHRSWPVEDPEAHDPAAAGLIIVADGDTAYVAPGEGGWTGDQALGQACRRVGLGPTCWKKTRKQTVVPVLTAFDGERFAGWDQDAAG